MRRPVRLTAGVAVLGLLAGACSGGSSGPGAAAIEPAGIDRLVVMLSDLSDDDLLAIEIVGDEIDLVLVEKGGDDCSLDTFADVEMTCDIDDLASAAARTSGPVVLIAAASLQRIGQLDAPLLARLDVFTATPVDDELAASMSSVTTVPESLGDEIAAVVQKVTGRQPPADEVPALVAALIGVDDTIATFEVVETLGGVQRATTGVSTERVETRFGIGATAPGDAPSERASVPAPELLWSVDFDPRTVGSHSRAAVVGPHLFIFGYDGVFRSLDSGTGEMEWTSDLSDGDPGQYASIVAGNGDVVLTSTGSGPPAAPGRKVVAFDPGTGDEFWRLGMEEPVFAGHPLLVDDVAFFWLSSDGDDEAFVAVDAMTGVVRWRTEAPVGVGQALFHDGVVYAGSRFGTLYGFDVVSGAVVFEFSVPGSVVGFGVASRPAVADGILYFGSDDGVFHAVDIAAGEIVWDFDVGSANLPSSPVIVDNLVIFGGWDEAVHALDRLTGESVWRTPTESFVLSSPALFGNSVVVVGTGTQLDGLDVTSGELIWRHETRELVADSPLVVDDTVYIQSPGRVEAIHPPER